MTDADGDGVWEHTENILAVPTSITSTASVTPTTRA